MPLKSGGRRSVSDEYADVLSQPRHTAIFWQPADNNELGTRNRISEFLRFDPERIHPITKERGAARLFFVKRNDTYPNGVQHILRETRAQRRLKAGTESGRPPVPDRLEGSRTIPAIPFPWRRAGPIRAPTGFPARRRCKYGLRRGPTPRRARSLLRRFRRSRAGIATPHVFPRTPLWSVRSNAPARRESAGADRRGHRPLAAVERCLAARGCPGFRVPPESCRSRERPFLAF